MSILILAQESNEYGRGVMTSCPAVAVIPRWNHAGLISIGIMGAIVCTILAYGIGVYFSFGAKMDIVRGRKDIAALREQVALLENEVLQKEQAIAVVHVEVIETMEEVSSIEFIGSESVAQSRGTHTP